MSCSEQKCEDQLITELKCLAINESNIISTMVCMGYFPFSILGFYSSNNAVDLDKNEEVMLLLSTSFNSSNKGSKSTWYWSDGEEISIDDIDNTEWNDVSDNAENTGCLYMLYDSCNSKVKTSTQCPLEKIHRGCLIKCKLLISSNIFKRY